MKITEMNKNMKKFIKALKSGRYEQIQGRYQSSKGYCAIGLISKLREKDPNFSSTSEWLGIKVNQIKKIILWNDFDKLSFKQIAERIEEGKL